MNILCVGQAVYDITFPCDEPIIENQKYRIYDRMECMGAPAANASYLCALWGANVSLMARIGKDLYGQEILQTLKKVGVDTTCMYEEETLATSISCIIANKRNGNRTILNSPMKEHPYPISFPQREIDVILMDGHELQASLDVLKQYPNAISILDAGTYKEEIKDLIQSVDYLVCSQDFAYQYTGIQVDIKERSTIEETFKKLKSINGNHIVVTLGDQGCIYEEEGTYQHLPAFHVKAVDTTGAGDIFHGAFAYAMSKSYSLHDALLISSLASAISVESLGGQPSIPDLTKMRSRIQEWKLNVSL